MSSIFTSPRFLSRVMWADAASCAATGALQLAATDALAHMSGLPAGLLTATGLFLVAYACLATAIAMRSTPPRTLIGLVAVGNFGWAIGCAAALALLHVAPLGWAWVLAQAVTVVVLAELQWMGLRATRTASTRAAMA